MWGRLAGILGVVIVVALGDSALAAPCVHHVEWRLSAAEARAPGALEAIAALAVWGPSPDHGWEAALAEADAARVTTAIMIDGRRVRLTLRAADDAACETAMRLGADRRRASWRAGDVEEARALPLARLAPTRLVAEQALMARAALGAGEAAPLAEPIAALDPTVSGPRAVDETTTWRPGRRTEDAAPGSDGRARLVLAWSLEPDELGRAAAAAADLAHPGGPLAARLTGAHGVADRVVVQVTTSPRALVLLVTTRDPRAARDRLLRELEAFEIDPRPAALEAYEAARDAAALERFVRRLARATASEIVQAAPEGNDHQAADTDDALLFVRASIDLRCPAPGETRGSNEILEEKHGLDAARYLALSRALGRDAERFQGIDLEIRDRCAERAKLARMMAPARVVALYKAVRCLVVHDEAERARAEAAVFVRHDVDPSALGPLVGLVREMPRWTSAVADVERRCPAPGSP